jgi:hypothetical protein
MIEVTVDTILPTPSGLRCGCTISYGKSGPIRFAQAVIPWRAFGRDTRAEMLAVFNKIVDEVDYGEPADPLF